eukprot:gene1951-2387_t
MSMQNLIDEKLIRTNCVSKAAIIGSIGGNTLASIPNDFLNEGEGIDIVNVFENSIDTITVGGIQYGILKAEERSIYAKNGFTSVSLVKTNQNIIIGFYDETKNPGSANNVVEKTAEYFLSHGI